MTDTIVFITDCFEVQIKNNQELCTKFMEFQIENKIFGPNGGYCGHGGLKTFVDIKHKEKVEQFFKEYR